MCIRDRLYRELRKSYQETGDEESLVKAKALLVEQQNITLGDRKRLLGYIAVSYTHLRAHETPEHLVCRLLLEKKKKNTTQKIIKSIHCTQNK